MVQFAHSAKLARRRAAEPPAAALESETAPEYSPKTTSSQLLALQRQVGNQAVLQLMRQGMLPLGGPTSPSSAIQRVPSRGDSKLVISDELGVISVVAAGSGFAHTIIYIEKADESWKLDLTAGGLASSGNDSERPSTQKSGVASGLASGASGTATVSGTGLTVNVVEASASDLALLASTSTKRSWSVSNAQLDAALQLGRDMSANADQYVYKLGGTGLTGSKRKATNCARFGEEILKSAGVSASSGIIFKTPAELATGKKRFFKPKSKQSAPNPEPQQAPVEVPNQYDI